MKMELCLKKIIAPLFVMSLAAIGFPFITAYINMKFTGKISHNFTIRILIGYDSSH